MISIDFLPTVGGITAHVYELSKALQKIGCKVTIATRLLDKSQKAHEVVDSLEVYRFELKYIGLLYGKQIDGFVKELLKNKEFDIIHIHGLRPLEFYSIKNPPLVFTNHTSGYLKRIKKGGYRVAILKRLFQKPKLFLAPSKELLETPFEIKAKKVFIPNGVIVDDFKKDESIRKSLREKFGLKESDILGIVTRRMVEKNGVYYLSLATKHIKNQNLKLLFIGDGNERQRVESELNKHFKDRFFMLGSLPHKEIVKYYSMADFSILPSLMEATSISGLEAMAASLPLVGTRVGGIPEIIKDGFNGLLCNPKDEADLASKIDKLLELDFKKMGENSLALAKEEFDWIKIAQKTKSEYEGIL
jgi:glycosyltransferase involved in cell wall biosynthesis